LNFSLNSPPTPLFGKEREGRMSTRIFLVFLYFPSFAKRG